MSREDDFYNLHETRPSGGRVMVALVLLLVICGLTAAAWTFIHLRNKSGAANEGAIQTTTAPTTAASPALPGNEAAATPEALNGRMADLEQRVIRVSVAAQSASAYANRAEAIMVAFAARRSLDAGAPLDYLEGQLRLLFGDAQPKAVATIINAAADPVTAGKLRAGLEDIGQLTDKGDAKESWWSVTTRNLGGLFVLRSAGSPAPESDQRLLRARRAVDAGQMEDAIKEVAALPRQPAVAQWLEQARRYNEAHRALDVIEQAAILEPRTTPMIAPTAAQPAAGSTTSEAQPSDAPKP